MKLPPPKQQNLPDPGTDSPFARLSLAAAPLFLESVIEGWRLEIETRFFYSSSSSSFPTSLVLPPGGKKCVERCWKGEGPNQRDLEGEGRGKTRDKRKSKKGGRRHSTKINQSVPGLR